MENINFIFHNDPGHGWLEVPVALLEKLQIADKITGFSYRKGAKAYLEEDCDLTTFFHAYLPSIGKEVKREHVQEFWSTVEDRYTGYQSPVRDYPGYYTN